MRLVFNFREWVGEDLGVHTNLLHQTFLHLGKFNKNNSLHFTSWQNFMLQEKIPAPCAWLLCLALLFVLVLSLSHEKGCLHEWIYNRYKVLLYLGKLCAYWCNIAMRNSNYTRWQFILMTKKHFKGQHVFCVGWDSAIGTLRFLWMSFLS